MSVVEKLRGLAQRIPESSYLQTEEATKNALVMPFLSALGYDVFDPTEVVPEFTADVGVKKGEKVDYAVKSDGEIILLVEAKKAGTELALAHSSQLYRYFSVTRARIAILTNGIQYRFYSDLEEPNKMDEVPFLEVDIRDLRDGALAELRRMSREAFDLETMLEAASDLKAMGQIRRTLERQFDEPDEDLVGYFYKDANPSGRFSKSKKEQFSRLVKKALQQAVADRVSDRLRTALQQETAAVDPAGPVSESAEPPGVAPESELPEPKEGSDIVTTEEELDGFRIVQAIVCALVSPSRVVHRDAKSYFAVLLDDNNRKPICRLHFNRKQKYLGLFDEQKNEIRHAIDSIEDIYGFSGQLRETLSRYLEPAVEGDVVPLTRASD